MSMTITPRVALEVAHHEAIVRQAYKDSVGVWTWSVGLTNASGHDVERYIDNPQTLEKCIEIFAWALEKYARQVRKAFEGHELTEAQFAAALSFHWNTGAIRRASWVRHWKAGNVKAAKKAFMNWRKPPEIEGRRRAERDLFFNGKWHNRGTVPEYTRLTRNNTPVWSSRIELDIKDRFEKVLAPRKSPQRPEPSAPDAPPDVDEQSRPSGFGAFFAFIAGLLGERRG